MSSTFPFSAETHKSKRTTKKKKTDDVASVKRAKLESDAARPETIFTKHLKAGKLENIHDLAHILEKTILNEARTLDPIPEHVLQLRHVRVWSDETLRKECHFFQQLMGRDSTIYISFKQVLSMMYRIFLLAKQQPTNFLASRFAIRDEAFEQLVNDSFTKPVVDFLMFRTSERFLPALVFDYLNNNGVEHTFTFANVYIFLCCASWYVRNKRGSDGSQFVVGRFMHQVLNCTNHNKAVDALLRSSGESNAGEACTPSHKKVRFAD
jgi:hypothetical protein